jgi:hypothetical protein
MSVKSANGYVAVNEQLQHGGLRQASHGMETRVGQERMMVIKGRSRRMAKIEVTVICTKLRLRLPAS